MPYEKGSGKRLVIALGGNALGNTPEEQLELVQDTAKHIVDLVAEGYDVVVSHGNGPQVGMI
ncbi:MAG: carbamate kinase, partial [Ruthenibacterium sp.]